MEAPAGTMISRQRPLANRLSGTPDARMRDRQYWMHLAILLGGCVLVTAPLFYCSLMQIIVTDHHLHIGLLRQGIETGVWPVHFLFHAAVYALSGFSREIVPLSNAATVVLTTCFLAKAWLTYGALAHCGTSLQNPAATRMDRRSHATILLFVCAALLVSAPIVRPWCTQRVYVGQISPNVWHNPTSIVCWPLVILLFFVANDFLRSGRLKLLAPIGALAAVSVLAKPNYFLAFAPVFSLLVLRRFGLSRALMLSQLAMLPTILVLCWQLTASFAGDHAMRPGRQIAFMPLAAWRVYSDSITLSVLFSLAFPLSYLILFRRSLQNRERVLFAWGVMLSAILWTVCFAEVSTVDGAVDSDFNFSWGAHLSLFMLFLVTAMDMLRNPAALQAFERHVKSGWREKLPWWFLGAHAVSGIYWIGRQAVGRGFY